jgi:hypothetical protein
LNLNGQGKTVEAAPSRFDFGNANAGQRRAIETVDGPVLITAGPGTGKTYTLVQRVLYLIQERGVSPDAILVATFTEKAARELVTRITNELPKHGIAPNLHEMYVGTFHSLCLRILEEHREHTRLQRNYRVLDAFDQSYTVFQNIWRFLAISEIKTALKNKGAWRQADEICSYVTKLIEEMNDPEELKKSSDPTVAWLGKMLEVYLTLLKGDNLLDFASIMAEAYRLLKNTPSVLAELQEKIQYIMIDEYQDTNYIQEQIVLLLAGERRNICVVGDDDQSLYRFRGATVRNILEFPEKFAAGECRIIPLDVNYRSESGIVNVGDAKYTKDEDIRNFNNLDVIGSVGNDRQFLILVNKGREGWNCRSLFGVALFRKPSSKIFVLQATMRCLRKITNEPQRDFSKYEKIIYEQPGIASAAGVTAHVLEIKEAMHYTLYTLVGRIACYMNISPLLVDKIVTESVDGPDKVVETVNKYNEVLYDVLVPKIFEAVYDVHKEKVAYKNEPKEIVLLSPKRGENGEPDWEACYEFSARPDLVVHRDDEVITHEGIYRSRPSLTLTPELRAKSFHADPYCFDSFPEKECFIQYLSSSKVSEVYFTGMFTSGQGEFAIQYYDTDAERIRHYYPDFVAKMTDGSYQIIEVKADNRIDDAQVKLKTAAASEIAAVSDVKYVIYTESDLKTDVLLF